MFTEFFKIFACATLIAGATGAIAQPLKVKGIVMNNPHNTILITGGSSGIGMALVERLLAEGHTVITCSWEEEK
jgi:NADPH:quinone reductase-like Zn-dependent oxidoreductase